MLCVRDPGIPVNMLMLQVQFRSKKDLIGTKYQSFEDLYDIYRFRKIDILYQSDPIFLNILTHISFQSFHIFPRWSSHVLPISTAGRPLSPRGGAGGKGATSPIPRGWRSLRISWEFHGNIGLLGIYILGIFILGIFILGICITYTSWDIKIHKNFWRFSEVIGVNSVIHCLGFPHWWKAFFWFTLTDLWNNLLH